MQSLPLHQPHLLHLLPTHLLLPGGVNQTPGGIVDGEIHIAGEDCEAIVAVVRTGVIPGVHLAEGQGHLLEDVLLFNAGGDQVGA